MNRRAFLSVLGLAAAAGCTSDSGSGDTPTPTATSTPAPTQTPSPTATPTTTATQTPTPEPADIRVTRVNVDEITVGERWAVEITLRNRGGQPGTFEDTVQYRIGNGRWTGDDRISETVDPGESIRKWAQFAYIGSEGSVSIRLKNAGITSTTTAELPQSEFQGSADEDRTYVDLQYRDYYDHEVEEIKAKAETIPYDTLLREAPDLRGRNIKYTATVRQLLSGENVNYNLLALNDQAEESAYASVVDDRFIRGDRIEFWGQVLGEEIYNDSANSEVTVPALAIADAKLLE